MPACLDGDLKSGASVADLFYLKINIGDYPDCPRNARKLIVP